MLWENSEEINLKYVLENIQNMRLSNTLIENNKKRKRYQGWSDKDVVEDMIKRFFEAIDEAIIGD